MRQQSVNAVIVEIRGRNAAAMTEDGAFVRIENNRYEVGQEILLAPEAAAKPARRARMTALASMAAGFLLLLLGGFKGYTMPAGVVSLDVNPSIEYTINVFDRVLDITAVNDDGNMILAGMDKQSLLYRPVDEAVDATILALRENGYLTGAANDIVISSSSYDARHTETIAERLGARVGEQDDLTVLSVPVSKGEVEDAHARGTSAGKLYIVEELEDSWSAPESFDADDWIERPVREIIHETEFQREGKNDDEDEDGKSTTGSPYKTPSDQQGANPQGSQQYQNDDSGEHEQESGETPESGEPKHD